MDYNSSIPRRFTKQQADELIPVVDELLICIQGTMGDAADIRKQLEQLEPSSLAALNLTHEMHFLFRMACGYSDQLKDLGVILEDVQAGIVSFPSRLDNLTTQLSWQQGDLEVAKVEFGVPMHRLQSQRFSA